VRALAVAAATKPERVLNTPPPVCHATALGESAITFVLRFWIEDPSNGVTNVKGDVLMALYDALAANSIELPFPQYEVRLKAEPHPGSDRQRGARRVS